MAKRLLLCFLVILSVAGCQNEALVSYHKPTYAKTELEGVTMTITEVTPSRVYYIIRVEKDNMEIAVANALYNLLEKWENNQWEMVAKRVFPEAGTGGSAITKEEPHYGVQAVDELFEKPLPSGRYRLICPIEHLGMQYSVKAEFEWQE